MSLLRPAENRSIVEQPAENQHEIEKKSVQIQTELVVEKDILIESAAVVNSNENMGSEDKAFAPQEMSTGINVDNLQQSVEQAEANETEEESNSPTESELPLKSFEIAFPEESHQPSGENHRSNEESYQSSEGRERADIVEHSPIDESFGVPESEELESALILSDETAFPQHDPVEVVKGDNDQEPPGKDAVFDDLPSYNAEQDLALSNNQADNENREEVSWDINSSLFEDETSSDRELSDLTDFSDLEVKLSELDNDIPSETSEFSSLETELAKLEQEHEEYSWSDYEKQFKFEDKP